VVDAINRNPRNPVRSCELDVQFNSTQYQHVADCSLPPVSSREDKAQPNVLASVSSDRDCAGCAEPSDLACVCNVVHTLQIGNRLAITALHACTTSRTKLHLWTIRRLQPATSRLSHPVEVRQRARLPRAQQLKVRRVLCKKRTKRANNTRRADCSYQQPIWRTASQTPQARPPAAIIEGMRQQRRKMQQPTESLLTLR
jgi:hypothetical protein